MNFDEFRESHEVSNYDIVCPGVSDDGRREFAVCVPPLYGAVASTTLVQFVELTRLLGAQHFIFYVVADVSPTVQRVFDAYRGTDDVELVTAIAWELPAVAARSVWYNAQLLAANDCLYRTSHAFHHVAFNDLDEFIVPRSVANWSLMLADLTARRNLDRRKQLAEPTDVQLTPARHR